jgi:5-(carboxyamino)imidazole ribonucleotide mutase
LNAAILACQMMATGDKEVFDKLVSYKADLKNKIVKANKDLAEISYQYKTN